MFEKASKWKVRFSTSKGMITSDDVWDLSLTDLNDLAKSLNNELKADEENFIAVKTAVDEKLELKFSIVKRVIEVRLAAIEKAENAAANKIKKDQILAVIADKEHSAIGNKSITALKKMLEELD